MFRWLIAFLCVFVFGCANSNQRQAFVMHDKTAFAMNSNPVCIRTRIVVEECDGKAVRDLVDIIKDIEYAETLFCDLNVYFVVVAFATAPADQDWEVYLTKDADRFPTCLNVYYCRAHLKGNEDCLGKSSFPWVVHSNGIVVYGANLTNTTFAHEIGHYFGLLHTFEKDWAQGNLVYNDYVDDTLSPTEYATLYPGDDYCNYNNLMNYHVCDVDFITHGQIERMRWFLMTSRTNTHMKYVFKNELVLDSAAASPLVQSPLPSWAHPSPLAK